MEVLLFGPGLGECSLIKLPNNKWVIIDCFIDPESQKPLPIFYFEKENIPFEDVCLIIITHWHSDHIAGISQVIDNCDNAKVVIPEAFTSDEYINFINEVSFDMSAAPLNATTEMSKAYKAIQRHFNFNKQAPILASEGTNLDIGEEHEIIALSPSNHAKIVSINEINGIYTKFKKANPRVHIIKPNANNHSIAVQISAKDCSFLFGGDLEEPPHNPQNNMGWSAVLGSTQFKRKKSILFKVPHHGSITGHHEDVWSQLLIEKPKSIMTTFSRSSLPLQRDLDRILEKSEEVFVTTPPKFFKGELRDKKWQRELEQFCKKIQKISGKTGFVKLKFDIDSGKCISNETNGMQIS